MTNQNKWIYTLGLAFIIGVANAASDKDAGYKEYARHGLIAMGPAAVALKVTLRNETKGPPDGEGKDTPEA